MRIARVLCGFAPTLQKITTRSSIFRNADTKTQSRNNPLGGLDDDRALSAGKLPFAWATAYPGTPEEKKFLEEARELLV